MAAAGRNARKYHLSFPPLRAAAHTALRLGGRLAPAMMVRQFDWLYRHDVTAGASNPATALTLAATGQPLPPAT